MKHFIRAVVHRRCAHFSLRPFFKTPLWRALFFDILNNSKVCRDAGIYNEDDMGVTI